MHEFTLSVARSAEEAAGALASAPYSRLLAGGTDLVPLMKEEVVEAEQLVALTGDGELRAIRLEDGALRIGALATLSEIAAHPLVQARYRALAQACRLAASPQLRNMGTIGGNLMQQTRCWYYRGPARCWLKGGETCYARDGENELHSVFMTDESPCVSAHPSDPAAALIALGASLKYVKARGEGEMMVEKLYKLPGGGDLGFWRLPEGAVITEVTLPSMPQGAKSVYRKGMSRAVWSFALAGVAAWVSGEGAGVEARISLSGVAPIPVRATDAERYLSEKGLMGVDATELASLAVVKARPLSQNDYKVALLRGLVGEALKELLGV